MKDLILIGGGGHCKACIDVIESEGEYQIIGILDSVDKVGETLLGYEYVGTDELIKHYVDAGAYFLITVGQVGDSGIRAKIAKELKLKSAMLATVISSRAYVAQTASISAGTIVMHDSLINAEAHVGSHCIINSKALIEHDSVIEDFSHISTGAVVNGGVKVGFGSFLGSNAVTQQGVSIAPNSFVKAGSCYSESKKKIAFLTTLFPVPEQYVKDFMRSLSHQTYKKFDLILMNDGYGDTGNLRVEFSELNIIEISAKGSIPKNREELIRFALVNEYDIAIFGDIDDYFSENRIQQTLKKLSNADIVVNELSPFSESESPTNHMLSGRVSDFHDDPLGFVLDKNIFGLSNTALNLEAVNGDVLLFPDDLVAVDWFFFSNLLLSGLKAVFSDEIITFYRQHVANTAGASEISGEYIRKAVAVRLGHFSHMSERNPRYQSLYQQELSLSRSLENHEEFKKILTKNQHQLSLPLWWELVV